MKRSIQDRESDLKRLLTIPTLPTCNICILFATFSLGMRCKSLNVVFLGGERKKLHHILRSTDYPIADAAASLQIYSLPLPPFCWCCSSFSSACLEYCTRRKDRRASERICCFNYGVPERQISHEITNAQLCRWQPLMDRAAVSSTNPDLAFVGLL